MGLITHILVNAGLLFLIGLLVDGIEVENGKAAVIGAIVLGLVNASVGKVLLILAFPVTFLTLGLFVFVVNALMLLFAAAFVDGFEVDGFGAALKASVGLWVMNMVVGVFFG